MATDEAAESFQRIGKVLGEELALIVEQLGITPDLAGKIVKMGVDVHVEMHHQNLRAPVVEQANKTASAMAERLAAAGLWPKAPTKGKKQ